MDERVSLKKMIVKTCLVVFASLFMMNNVHAANKISERLARALINKSETVGRSIVTQAKTNQSQNLKRVELQSQADRLRVEIGGTTDARTRQTLNKQLQTIQKQIQMLH
ncbi:hypothetical protein [Pantoea sp.]|uniref:hypothetical protein n=1 Tax=Pantoea sp. TaxID=69393 RepID=UPI002897C1F3|nr:hypothetical protein [Pantoea sp.]